MITVKILSYKSPQRYAVRQTLKVAQKELQKNFPELEIHVEELKTLEQMEQYTPVVILPSLVMNENTGVRRTLSKKG